MTDPITEADLHAFVDDQLDVARRIEVEDHLAQHPDVAARVMADMRSRDALKLVFGRLPAPPSHRVLDAARRLERSLAWREIGLRCRQAAAVALLIGLGWFAHEKAGLFEITDTEASPKPPAFVADALHSHDTALLRARMVSQLETPDYDTAEILREAGIAMPSLPAEWRVTDVQLFPSQAGHSVEVALDAEALGRISLFAARTSTFGVIAPTVARFAASRTVYWQSGPFVYALTGTASESALERAAVKLADSLR
jgi:anti-sigma factor RsiW